MKLIIFAIFYETNCNSLFFKCKVSRYSGHTVSLYLYLYLFGGILPKQCEVSRWKKWKKLQMGPAIFFYRLKNSNRKEPQVKWKNLNSLLFSLSHSLPTVLYCFIEQNQLKPNCNFVLTIFEFLARGFCIINHKTSFSFTFIYYFFLAKISPSGPGDNKLYFHLFIYFVQRSISIFSTSMHSNFQPKYFISVWSETRKC